jgi:hypothetical protein
MLRTQIAAAIGCARANALDEIMREVWTRYSAGQLSEEDAGQLSALAQERRAAWRGSGQVALGLVLPPPAERCPTPVRRHSYFRGQSERRLWRPTNRQEVRQIVVAARRYELAEKQFGQRNGPLGSVAIEVLELFANLVDFRTGRLDPSLDWIMGKLRRSRAAVVAALKALRAHGFLDWLRRYEPTGNEGRGPQVQQTSNAYRMSLPERARKLLGRYFKAPPPPDDAQQEAAERAAVIEAHRASLSELERTIFDVDPNNAIGAALIGLARAREASKQRESARQTESPSGFILKAQT